jgi:DNA-binding NtrC family response regulator
VISDINFEQSITGIEVLRAIKQARPETEVILVSGFGTLDTAISSVREGAFDYVSKPFNVDEVRTIVRRALERGQQKRAEGSSAGVEEPEPFIVGSSPRMLAQGESGTGKELVARAIHAKGPRAPQRFLAVNCGALTETLLESELFGHVKGAFTGAVADKHGLLQAAHDGTLFLDEISETSPALQIKLLRVLQEGEYTPVGSTKVFKANVRVIAATNRDLEALIRDGKFREDLFYRLNVVTIVVPPLRERAEDIPKLIAHFSRHLATEGHPTPQFSPKALDRLRRYSWPGNVRELENAVERLALFSRGRLIDVEDLPPSKAGGS